MSTVSLTRDFILYFACRGVQVKYKLDFEIMIKLPWRLSSIVHIPMIGLVDCISVTIGTVPYIFLLLHVLLLIGRMNAIGFCSIHGGVWHFQLMRPGTRTAVQV